MATPQESCVNQADCSDEYACVTIAGASYCQPICTGNADACSATASCGGVGATSINVCQPEEETPAEGTTPEETAPEPEEQPTLPCETDADCSKFQSDAICVQFDGVKDCTIPCSMESDCDIPAIAGFEVDFLTCLDDEADMSRMGCVPDAACFTNPMRCISLPSQFGGLDPNGDGDEDFDDFDDFDFQVNTAVSCLVDTSDVESREGEFSFPAHSNLP